MPFIGNAECHLHQTLRAAAPGWYILYPWPNGWYILYPWPSTPHCFKKSDAVLQWPYINCESLLATQPELLLELAPLGRMRWLTVDDSSQFTPGVATTAALTQLCCMCPALEQVCIRVPGGWEDGDSKRPEVRAWRQCIGDVHAALVPLGRAGVRVQLR